LTLKSLGERIFIMKRLLLILIEIKRKYFTTVWKKRPDTNDPDFMDRDNL